MLFAIINKAKTIHLAKQEKETGVTSVNFTVSGRYKGDTTEDNPESLKMIVAEVKVLVFRIVDKIEENRLMPISEHTAKTMELYLALAQAEIDEIYGYLGIKIKFQKEIKI